VRAESVIEVMGNDALSYFLLREVPFGQDGSFSFDAVVQRYNSDLANDLGNLSSRTLTMINRYFGGSIPYPSPLVAKKGADDAIRDQAQATIAEFNQLFDEYQFNRALECAWTLVASVNKYLVEQEPWIVAEKEGEENKARLATILYTAAEALRIVTALTSPVLPESAEKIWQQLGLGDITKFNLSDLKWGQLPLGGKLGKVEPVFPRADKSTIERMQQMEQERGRSSAPQPAAVAQTSTSATSAPAGEGARPGQPATQAAHGPTDAAPAPKPAPAAPNGKISIDDFLKVEMRVGQVKHAEKVKGADKLLRLEVDIGSEVRQVVAGIALAYEPEKLIGRKVVIVANLAPRKLRGLESNGMIVAASAGAEDRPVLASFLEDVPVGAKLK
jgi:methionyl-tRNA synthetase